MAAEHAWQSMPSITAAANTDFYAWLEIDNASNSTPALRLHLQRKQGQQWQTVASSWGDEESQGLMLDEARAGEYRWRLESKSAARFRVWYRAR